MSIFPSTSSPPPNSFVLRNLKGVTINSSLPQSQIPLSVALLLPTLTPMCMLASIPLPLPDFCLCYLLPFTYLLFLTYAEFFLLRPLTQFVSRVGTIYVVASSERSTVAPIPGDFSLSNGRVSVLNIQRHEGNFYVQFDVWNLLCELF